MNSDELEKLLAKPGYGIVGSTAADRKTPDAIMECAPRDAALGKTQTKRRDTGFFLVRVTSFRRRLLDEDNICEKYHVDCCRYAGVLPSDAAGKARIETRQEKVARKEDERTEIVIERLP